MIVEKYDNVSRKYISDTSKPWPHRVSASVSALTLVIAHIDLYLFNPHQASVSSPFSSFDACINADADADAWCGQGLNVEFTMCALNTLPET